MLGNIRADTVLTIATPSRYCAHPCNVDL